MRIRLLTALAAVIAALALGTPAPAATSTQLHSFRTPSGNIGCMAGEFEGTWELRCDISGDIQEWRGGRQRDCELDSGDSIGLQATGRPYWVCHGDTVLGSGRVLGYGSTWRAGPFTCTSARTGITCRNRAQRGFSMSRQSYRFF
jgi:hypothetical protein